MQVLNGFYCDGGKNSLQNKTKPKKITPPPNESVSVMIKSRPVLHWHHWEITEVTGVSSRTMVHTTQAGRSRCEWRTTRARPCHGQPDPRPNHHWKPLLSDQAKDRWAQAIKKSWIWTFWVEPLLVFSPFQMNVQELIEMFVFRENHKDQ